MFYHITTYGCQMNVHESEKLAGQLESLGYQSTDNVEDADIILFNTCTIRENAVDKAHGHIGALKSLKKKKKNIILAIGGCLTQDKIEAEKLKNKFPFIDIIFGTHNVHKFGEMVLEVRKNRGLLFDVWDSEGEILPEDQMARTSFPNAWVNIMFGCNNFCTYCIVPYVRGRERSRHMVDIEREVENLLKDGYKEITLLGQNVNSYGNDLDSDEENFVNLMERLAKLPYKYRLRFMTSHPKDFTEELAMVIGKYDNISKFIHLPVQAGSNKVLKEMNRRYTREDYLEKVAFIKKHVKDYALSTDLMVGFPNESQEDFEETLKLAEEVRFDSAFTFIYSVRNGTKASEMSGHISEEEKSRRIGELIKVQNAISKQISDTYIGKTVEVLVENDKGDRSNGRTDSGKLVTFPTNENLVGQMVNVKITATTISALKGIMENEKK